jgi:Kef-type K+ transport system membrane component KefB
MYGDLAIVVLAGLLGPLLASGRRLRVPMLVAELIGGILLGRTTLHLIDPASQPFPVFASIGFAMLMLESGTEIDLGSKRLRDSAVRAGLAFLVTLVVAVPAGLVIGVRVASSCASSANRTASHSNSRGWQPGSSSQRSSSCWGPVSI